MFSIISPLFVRNGSTAGGREVRLLQKKGVLLDQGLLQLCDADRAANSKHMT